MQIKYHKLEGDVGKKLDSLFGVQNCLIKVQPGDVLLPPKYTEMGERILNMQVRHDDIWLVSYPRTGSTWAQEMVWCLANDLNYEGAKLLSQFRTPLLELTALLGNDSRSWKEVLGNSVEQVENMPSPRFIKTHLPWQLLPKQLEIVKPKIFYVARNPKDQCVSYYYYCKLLHDFHGTFDDFCDLMLKGDVPLGSILNHYEEFWKRRNEPNILFLKYENMKKGHKEAIRQAASFLDKNFTEGEIDGLVEYLSFQKMKSNQALNLEPLLEMMYEKEEGKPPPENTFIRKGQVGDWKNHMSEEISHIFDEWIEARFCHIGLKFE